MKRNILLAAAAIVTTIMGGPSASFAENILGKNSSSYNSSVTYTGSYDNSGLYYRNPGNPKWMVVLKNGIEGLKCSDAVKQLKRSGRWMGHLNSDNSCGPTAEPSEWALGNRINFEAGGSAIEESK